MMKNNSQHGKKTTKNMHITLNNRLTPIFYIYRELSEKVVEGYRPCIPGEWPPVMTYIIMACWQPEPSKRPTMEAVCLKLRQLEGKSLDEIQKLQNKQKRLSRFVVPSATVNTPVQIFKEAAQAAKTKTEKRTKRLRTPSLHKNKSTLFPRKFYK